MFSMILSAIAISAAGAAAPGAAAQSFPPRPLRAIVGFVPGGATDILARQLGQKLTESLGQQVIVDNRPGGSGVIAAAMAKDAAPDGHTLFFGTISTLTTNVATIAKPPAPIGWRPLPCPRGKPRSPSTMSRALPAT